MHQDADLREVYKRLAEQWAARSIAQDTGLRNRRSGLDSLAAYQVWKRSSNWQSSRLLTEGLWDHTPPLPPVRGHNSIG